MSSSTVGGNTAGTRGGVVSARRGPLKMTFRENASGARLTFAVPKSVGTAVVRNRCRRRVREALRELARDGAVSFVSGDYRFSVFAPLDTWSAQALRSELTALASAPQRR